ncbi:unnamed protein product, partial [Rotaria sp. Silwood1]
MVINHVDLSTVKEVSPSQYSSHSSNVPIKNRQEEYDIIY